MGRIIGIDLGTTNSVAAYWKKRHPKPIMNSSGSSLTPSVVALEQGARYVGQEGKDWRNSGSRNIVYSVKRFIGRDFDDEKTQAALGRHLSYQVRKAENGEVEIKLGDTYYSPVEISAMILEKLKKDAEQELGEEVTHAVITVPAYFSQRQKNATREAGKLAGLQVLRIINEPTAAALAFGVEENITEPEHVLVYDLGGGTFDVSILLVSKGNLEVLRIDGDNFLGGDDFDSLIMTEMLQQIQQQSGEKFSNDESIMNILKGHAEQLKINLSREEHGRAVAPGIAKSKRGSPVNLDYTLTRAQFEQMISSLIERSLDIVKRALAEEKISVDEIDRVLLVGGSTRIPLVRRRLKEMFGDKIQIDVDPMQCVALGAAVQTSIPIEWLCPYCHSMNEGTEETCGKCKKPREEDGDMPVIECGHCGKANRQGRLKCWSCNVPLGAFVEDDEEESEGDQQEIPYMRIGDITAKHLGVEALQSKQTSKDSGIKIVIPKGTGYPTFEPHTATFYTNHSGQEVIVIPVFELEQEDAKKDQWEYVGQVINDRIPPGTPEDTPVIVEMRIDGDGILTVLSYLKRMKEETLVQKSFHFSGSGKTASDGDSKALDELDVWTFILNVMANMKAISRHIREEDIEKSNKLIEEAKQMIDTKDENRAKPMIERIQAQIQAFPPQTRFLFWAYWAMEQSQLTPDDCNQLKQLINQMENAGAKGDNQLATKYMKQLAETTNSLLAKVPSNLLKGFRG